MAAPEPGLLLKRLDREKVEESDDGLSFIIGRALRDAFVPVPARGRENDVTTDGAIVKNAIRARVGVADKIYGSFILRQSLRPRIYYGNLLSAGKSKALLFLRESALGLIDASNNLGSSVERRLMRMGRALSSGHRQSRLHNTLHFLRSGDLARSAVRGPCFAPILTSSKLRNHSFFWREATNPILKVTNNVTFIIQKRLASHSCFQFVAP